MPNLEPCDRCQLERELVARVTSEIIDLRVCAFCAREARELKLAVMPLAERERL